MTFSTAIFISAWEQRGLETAAEHEGLGPGLLAIDPHVLNQLLAFHVEQTCTRSQSVPWTPMPWGARCCPSCRQVSFPASHWSVRDHAWTHVFIEPRELESEGEEDFDIQLISLLSPTQNVTSSPFRISELVELVTKLKAAGTFLLVTKDSVYPFEEFASFENLFRQHLEGNWGLAAEFCSVDVDELAMPEELP